MTGSAHDPSTEPHPWALDARVNDGTGRAATGTRRHGGLPPHGVLITVQDLGASEIPCTREPGSDATGGRGLLLVNDLATRWGFHRDSIGTVIWFELGPTE
ncbi:ATP-binding protein [Streptosporangium sp. NPDC006013]|uniref:ATP-binding protein n=1 Tax=Streptosporangium sp. NPDC006013 TaxID=3155596 RepID=UPI0033BCD0C0